MSKILVTGADGFIGSHLVEHLVRFGHDVRAFVLYNSFNSWGWLDSCAPDVVGKFEVFSGDIRDPHGVRAAMQDCNVVLHLAALIGIPYSYHSPDTYVDTNIKGTLNVLQAGRDLGVEQIIHTSTSEVYGSAQYVPITEVHPLEGQSPYSASKIGADQMALAFHRSFDMPVTIMRPFNTYGPRQSARAVIPTVISQLAVGDGPIRLGSVHPTRDFSYVSDTVNGFVSAIGIERTFGEIINLGSGFEVSIETTVQMIEEIMGVTTDVQTHEDRVRPPLSEVDRLWADTSKAKGLLGWQPSYGGLDGFRRGLQETITWFTEPENLVRYKSEVYNV
ncbi:MAG: NAD-dependent 4,6-dehydratase LegB [Candidatus Nanopelagicales bacterium]|nr:NAD-dependent 4,6-dehydratase LegB [Candidatus Nanopelagicales bacterium]